MPQVPVPMAVFDNGGWGDGRKDDDVIRVRSCLAF